MGFHVEPPEIAPPEPGSGPWGAIGYLLALIGLGIVVFVVWKHL